jgi:hypothetical protein
MTTKYTLYIDAFTPDEISLARLSQYLARFAALLGHEDGVTFGEIRTGSTALASIASDTCEKSIHSNLTALSAGSAPAQLCKKFDKLDAMLAEDDATAYIYENDQKSAQILFFPGEAPTTVDPIGPLTQSDDLEGVLISVGGADATIHLKLQVGGQTITGIEADRTFAREVAKHMFEPVRISGVARWIRNESAEWQLKNFKAETFEPLQSENLEQAIKSLRDSEESEWASIEDVSKAIENLRDSSNED